MCEVNKALPFPSLQRHSVRGVNLLTVYSTHDTREKKNLQNSVGRHLNALSLAFVSRCFKRCVTFRRFKLQAAVDYANLFFNILFELQIITRSKVWYLGKILR